GIAAEHRDEVLLTHITFHAAVLVFTGLGACLGFFLLRNSLPSLGWALSTGAAFGLISILGISGMLRLTGIYGVIGWLFFGATLSALASRLLSRWSGRTLSTTPQRPSPPESR
ncbi:MAG: hypothetical protein M3Z15_07985, partial [Pseudomonadota bacterium]|nr:hypothetical protein [Pseudomonadota bacterium]